MRKRLPTALVLIAAPFALANGNAVVTLCNIDDEVGPVLGPVAPINLTDAIKLGGSITFRCPANTVLKVTRLHRITRALTIDGGNGIILDGGNTSSMFESDGGAYIIGLQNLTIRNARFPPPAPGILLPPGITPPSAVLNLAYFATLDHVRIENSVNPIMATSLQVSNSLFNNNSGVVLRGETVTLRGVQFNNNDGEPVQNRQKRVSFLNGPTQINVPISGSLEIAQSQFFNNAHIDWTGTLAVSDSAFAQNGHGLGAGGALEVSGPATLSNTTFTGNSAVNGGAVLTTNGGLQMRRVTFEANRAGDQGGAIYADNTDNKVRADVVARASTFRANTAARGGAVLLESSSDRHISFSGQAMTFAGNTATGDGGAIHAAFGGVSLLRTVFVKNTSGGTGAALFAAGPVTRTSLLANTLITGNTAAKGSTLVTGAATLINVTIAANVGGLGLKPARTEDRAIGKVALVNTLLANNSGGNCQGGAGALENSGSNLQFPGATCGSIPIADPQLDAWGVLSPGSPAIGAGNDKICTTDPIGRRDLYGHHRPLGQHCAIGAVEGDLEREALLTMRTLRQIPERLKDLWRVLNSKQN